jgi:aldehyde dehydrogenase (NAD+)
MKTEVSPDSPITEIDRVYHLQKDYLPLARNTGVKERLVKLKRLKKVILLHRNEFQQAMYADYNKPAAEVDIAEIFTLLNELGHVIRRLQLWTSKHHVPTPWYLTGANSYIHYEPKGHALVFSPWNFPIHLTLMPLIYSYAAGNVTVIKPSEFTPYSVEVVKKVIRMVFEEKEAWVAEGGVTVGQHLLSLRFNHIFFTGSPSVGKIVMKAAAEHLSSVTLELGGKSPLIIDETADLKLACTFAATTKFINSGQYCISPDYVFVHESVKDEFVREFIRQAELKFGKNEEDWLTRDYCLMVNGRHLNRVKAILDDAIALGARLEYGGHVNAEKELISPTVLSGAREGMKILEEEIFGPILLLRTYRDLGEVIQTVNRGETPLSLYLFSRKRATKKRIRKEIQAGTMCINTMAVHYYNYHLPFGGHNSSGIGQSHGFWSFCEFSNAKAVMNQWSPFNGIKLVLPPFTRLKKILINWLIRLT